MQECLKLTASQAATRLASIRSGMSCLWTATALPRQELQLVHANRAACRVAVEGEDRHVCLRRTLRWSETSVGHHGEIAYTAPFPSTGAGRDFEMRHHCTLESGFVMEMVSSALKGFGSEDDMKEP
ncbi:hypothetical protein E2P81_ATG04893 [Venturia nashicola]|nr:hypothetical protein E2P81_ATG04893 [Venturia nashicola]